jgi:hypothetical protein
MLITFTSKVYPDVVMFGEVAMRLLKAMGQSEQPPGILRGGDIREAAERLREYLGTVPKDTAFPEEEDKNKTEEENKEARNRVGLRIRAQPLLELLEASYHREADVIWR